MSLPSVILCGSQAGFFSHFLIILGALDLYENHIISGVEVSFGHGLYLDLSHGSNWWEYYFEPIKIGKFDGEINRMENMSPWGALADRGESLDRKHAHGLIEKYIKIKPWINDIISNYIRDHGPIDIGIHYRGTDKIRESPRSPYEKSIEEIDKLNSQRNLKIYVATDEQAFLDTIKHRYPHVVFYSTIRSNNGKCIHENNDHDHFQLGLEAVIDCLILSKCGLLIRTSSNLSLVSTYFNYDYRVINTNYRHGNTRV
jgi:hypothetical protein